MLSHHQVGSARPEISTLGIDFVAEALSSITEVTSSAGIVRGEADVLERQIREGLAAERSPGNTQRATNRVAH